MDPDQTLNELRELLASDAAPDMYEAIYARIDALDRWLSGGGFLPEAWKGCR